MNSFRRASTSLVLALALPAAGATAAQAAPVEPSPVVFALDSSRSLSAAESRATADLTKALLAGLPSAAPSGVLTFDDEVRWLARPGATGASGAQGASEAMTALDALSPAGRFTVLHDGLIEGLRALPDGGVLVLLSDGMDENSATTLEDAARLASERGVRLVTVGAGRADERTLRRLALLTGGHYAGRVGTLDVPTLQSGIATLRQEADEQRAARTPPPPPPAAPLTTDTAAAELQDPGREAKPAPDPSGSSARWLLAMGAVVAALGIVLGYLLARRRAGTQAQEAQELERGTQPGVQWPEAAPPPVPAPTSTGGNAPSATAAFSAPPQPIDEVQIARVRLRPAVRPQGLMEISLDETAEFQRLPFSESIERTLVLTAEVVLTVREPGRTPRSFRLPPDRAVDVGRDATLNTLAFQDPTMSTQHLRVVLDNDEVYLVDLGSTNGVLVGDRRVDAVHLHPGDRFRAGMIEFEIGLHHASMGRVETA